MAKKQQPSLFKKCPSCKFAKCWARAVECEECGYNFKLGRKVRKAVAPTFDDDEDDVQTPAPEPVAAKATHKECPGCKAQCWHAAPFCEKCEWNFKTNAPKEKPKPVKVETPAEPAQPRYFGAGVLVLCPAFGGYGKIVADDRRTILKVKPPPAEKATYNNIAQWIQRLQDFGLTRRPSEEYSLNAVLKTLEMQLTGGKWLEGHAREADYRKIAALVNAIWNDLETTGELQFTVENVEEMPDEPPPAPEVEDEEEAPQPVQQKAKIIKTNRPASKKDNRRKSKVS